ncbi:MAG: cupin-like domain-containing protein [bacterium]
MTHAAVASPLAAAAVERIQPPSVAAFRRDYAATRRPVILSGLAADWPAARRWSLDYLQDRFAPTPVRTFRTAGGEVVMRSATGAIEGTMPLGEFIAQLRRGTPHCYLTSRLADLPAALRGDAPTPDYCAEASWQNGNLWIGAAGTVAPLHRDLADNLHAVVRGRKRLTLVAPAHSAGVYPNALLDNFPNGCRANIEVPDFAAFPKLRGIETLVAEVEAGDAIYIPRRWWHHVRTLETSIAVNFWWASGGRRALVVAIDRFKRWRGINR